MRQIFEKIIEGKKLTDAERAEFLLWAERAAALTVPPAQNVTIVEQNITPLRTMVQAEVEGMLKSRNWIPQLSDISLQLGLVQAGEFRSGNGNAPGDGFTGGRFGYPGFTYDGTDYFLAGVEDDALQVGLSLTDGKIYAGAGAVVLDADGIVATAGTIGGWVIGANSLTSDSGSVGLSSEETGGADIRFWAGSATPSNAPFRVSESGGLTASGADISGTITASTGTIGGWSITSSHIKVLDGTVGIILNANVPSIQVGDTGGNHLVLDGENQRIRSSNFVAGAAGFNIAADTGDAEFNNLTARGMIKTAVFEKDTVSSVGGQLLVLDSDTLATDMTSADNSTLTIAGNTTFSAGDILRMKGGGDDEWLEVTNAASAPTYTVTRDKAAAYAADSNPEWKKGQAVVNYGVSGSGGVELVAGADPAMIVFTHAGSPWTTITEVAKLDEGGIHLANEAGVIYFRNAAGTDAPIQIYGNTNDDLLLVNDSLGSRIRLIVEDTAGSVTGLNLYFQEDPDNNNVAQLDVSPGTAGAKISIGNSVVIWGMVDGAETVFNNDSYDIDFRIEGASNPYVFCVNAGLDRVEFANSSGIAAHIISAASGGRVYFNEANDDIDFSVEGDNSGQVLYIDAGLDKATSFVWDGWGLAHETWTRTGNHTFTISGDVTAKYRKGTKVKYNDGAVEYGVIASSSHAAGTTTVTLITNSDYAMAAATINDRYISYVDRPEGFPQSFTFTATVTGESSMTWSTTSNQHAEWMPAANGKIQVSLFLIGTVGGTPAKKFYVAPPVAVAAPFTSATLGICQVRDSGSGSSIVGSGYIDSTNGITIYKPDDSNWSAGTNRLILWNGIYTY